MNKFSILLILISGNIFSQEIPNDFLGSDFHQNRRAALRGKLQENSVAVLFANPERNRSNDVDYMYHQDPNFYYLTGYREPNAVLIILKEDEIGSRHQ